jgi:hypothetical protein
VEKFSTDEQTSQSWSKTRAFSKRLPELPMPIPWQEHVWKMGNAFVNLLMQLLGMQPGQPHDPPALNAPITRTQWQK